jgi:hypothetical protein
MKTYSCPQYSKTWWSVRRGVPTASEFSRIFTASGDLSRQSVAYIEELVAARVNPDTDYYAGGYVSDAMQRGKALEPEARAEYDLRNDPVTQVGFCVTDDGRFGCSPDGLVGGNGLLELKCPLPATHERYLRKGVLPTKYRPQVHGQLLVTGRKWCDFVSYCPGSKTLCVRVYPDAYTLALRGALETMYRTYAKSLMAEVEKLNAPIPLDWEELENRYGSN